MPFDFYHKQKTHQKVSPLPMPNPTISDEHPRQQSTVDSFTSTFGDFSIVNRFTNLQRRASCAYAPLRVNMQTKLAPTTATLWLWFWRRQTLIYGKQQHWQQ